MKRSDPEASAKKLDPYLCGALIDEKEALPKHFEYFFDMKMLFVLLAVLTILLLVGAPP